MKIVTEEELKNHGRATLRGYGEGAVFGLAISVPASYYLHLRSVYYKRLPITIKALGIVLLTAPCIAIQAERRGIQYDMEYNWQGIAKAELNREAVQEQQRWQNLSLTQKATDWVLRYRWHLFVAGWATSMGVAWMILRRNKTQTFAQKIVQARVYAQGIALAGLLGAAAFSQMRDPDHNSKRDTADHSWQRFIQEQPVEPPAKAHS